MKNHSENYDFVSTQELIYHVLIDILERLFIKISREEKHSNIGVEKDTDRQT